MAYDELRHPRNTEAPPIDDSESGMRVVNPKLALRWNITPEIRLRAMYAQSLGGVFYDQSARLEPVQLAGFVQAFRNGIPESVAGLVPGMRFDIFGAAIDAQISAHSWVMVSFEGMNTRARRSSGAYFRYETDLEDARPDQLIEDIRYQERAVSVTWNRLLGDCWSAGAQFRFSHAASDHLFQSALPLKTFLGDDSWQHREIEALLFSSRVFVRFQDPGGFFADAEGLHFAQVKEWQMYEGSPSEGDAFFHLNAAAGFRWAQRRAELRVTALNLLAQDYHLHSFNGPVALPRDRTLAVSFRFEF
jgi:hypothetical protein